MVGNRPSTENVEPVPAHSSSSSSKQSECQSVETSVHDDALFELMKESFLLPVDDMPVKMFLRSSQFPCVATSARAGLRYVAPNDSTLRVATLKSYMSHTTFEPMISLDL